MTAFKTALSRIKTTKGATHFDKPLKEAISMFNTRNGGRETVPNFFILFTDGNSNVEFQEAANELKRTGTTVIVVGIGKYAKDNQLQSIASPGYVLKVRSFKELGDIAGRLASLACKDPCSSTQCDFYGECTVNENGTTACKCPEQCPKKVDYVCGSDGRNYENDCLLRREVCTKKKRLSVNDLGECGLCSQTSCLNYSKCALKDDGTAECICPTLSNCPKEIKPACGHDGVTYVNDCFRKVASCKRKKVIPLAHPGECDMCKTKKCSLYSKCIVDNEGKAKCKCPDERTCPQVADAVCGTDGETYLNDCVRKARSCKKGILVEKDKDGACDVCTFVKSCKHHAKCVENVDKTLKCICPVKCPASGRKVCGSNDKTYESECLMKVDACKKKLPLTKKHDGPCGECKTKNCHRYAKCETNDDGSAVCKCPEKSSCPLESDPVCGSDSQTYPNVCELKAAACKAGKQTVSRHKGKCGVCSTMNCQEYETCKEVNGEAVCGCPTVDACPRDVNIVCGDDGKSYLTKCRMKLEACKKKRPIVARHDGICDPCSVSNCRNNGTCSLKEDGSTACACPVAENCPTTTKQVCGSNRETFTNECHLRASACKKGKPIYVKKPGVCSSCTFANCKHNKECSVKPDNTVQCSCTTSCPTERDPVCGTDGKTYPTKCHLEKESCENEKFLEVEKKGNCDACSQVKCHSDSECVVESNGQTACKCKDPTRCPATVKEVCGTDGRTYKNKCLLKAASCKGPKRFKVARDGPCGLIEDFCSVKNCKHGGRCNSKAKCVCRKVEDCPPDPRRVCGTDGNTYKNQCHLDVTSCERQMLIEATKLGTCDTCAGKNCSNNGKCVAMQGKDSKCKCPKLADCSRKIELVCGKTDQETYINYCAQKVHSCRKQKPSGVLEENYCSVCSLVECPFNGECTPGENGGVTCSCIRGCPRVKDVVCANDNKPYYSECVMKKMSCEAKQPLKVVHKGVCGTKTNYDLKFTGKEKDFVEFKDLPKLKEVTVAFWVKTIDKTKKGTIFSYSVPGKRNALSLADPNGLRLYVNGDEKDGVHKKTGVVVNDDKWHQITLTWRNSDGSWKLFKNGKLAASGSDFQKGVVIPAGGTLTLGQLQEEPGYRYEPDWAFIGDLSKFNVWSKELPLSEITAFAESCGTMSRGDAVTWCDAKKMVFGKVKVISPSICPNNTDDPCCGATCPKFAKCDVNKERKAICVCQNIDDCPAYQDLVCGSDGKTYGNRCLMKTTACKEMKAIEVVANRKCDACTETKCDHYAKCELGVDGLPKCVCPKIKSCPAIIKPVCGSNGKSYINECRLKVDSCKKNKKILVRKEGICDNCMFTSCPFYGSCSVDEQGSTTCSCPEAYSCPQGIVCASDGLSYRDECSMKKEACKKNKQLVVVNRGACNACSGEKCEAFTQCKVINGSPKCVCHDMKECPTSGPRVCGSNGKPYSSACHLRVDACIRKRPIYVVSIGNCDLCSKKTCKFNSECEVDASNQPHCVCPKAKCPKTHEPVCGDDGHTYDNLCALKAESCSKKKPIKVKNQGVCGIIENSCTLKTCKHYAICQKGKCICPKKEECPQYSKRVCASDGQVYTNDCHMKAESCKLGKTLLDVGMEKCSLCLFARCPVNGLCVLKEDGTTTCQCPDPKACPAEFSRVCATNDKTYNNTCHMEVDECRKNKIIGIAKRGSCEKVVKYFQGISYMQFATPLRMVGKMTNVEFSIRPLQENGILLFADDRKVADFIALVLNNGHLEFRMNLGDGIATKKSKSQLEMNKWYHIKVTRQGKLTELLINQKEKTTIVSPKNYTVLNIGDKLYFGGVEKLTTRSKQKLHITDGFVGCLKDLKMSFKEYDLHYPGADIIKQRNITKCPADPCKTRPCENSAQCKFDPKMGDTYICLCPKGFVGKRCQGKDKAVYLKGAGSYAELDVFEDNTKFAVSMDIRPVTKDGMIVYGEDLRSSEFVSIGIKNGFVEVSLNAGQGKITVKSKQPVSLMDWHNIKVTRDRKIVTLTVDKQNIVKGTLPKTFAEIDLKTALTIGEPKQPVKRIAARTRSGLEYSYFTGCIKNLVIDDHSINFAATNGDTLDQKGLAPCHACTGNPCGDHGECIASADGTFTCNCDDKYSGKFCDTNERIVYFTGKGSMMILAVKKEYSDFDISFNIRPQVKTAPIVITFKEVDFISIAMRDGIVEARSNAGSGKSFVRSQDSIDLHKWHKIRLIRNSKQMRLYVDNHDVITAKNNGNSQKINLKEIMYVGTVYTDDTTSPDRRYGLNYTELKGDFQFIGCMSNVTLNGKRLDLNYTGDDVKKERLVTECTSCNPTPCKHNGTCVPEPGLTYSCRCSQSFTGSVCEVPGCAVGALDLAFVLDDSNSVNDEEFHDVIKFVTYMIDAYPGISASGTRVGVVMFSTNAEISIAFDRYYQREQLVAAVKSLTRIRGKTFINEGLEKANELFTPARGSRNDASKVVVLMTDGKSKGDVVPPAQRLREKGVRVIVVGVGSVDPIQLEQIAGVKENVFLVPTFKGLEPVIAKLIPASCPRPKSSP